MKKGVEGINKSALSLHLLTVAVASVLGSTVSHGQTEAGEALVLEEVVVTAQKREESVQDVPSTVNVISGTQLQDFTAYNFNDLEKLSAGLSIEQVTARGGSVALRGISFDPSSAASAAVVVYWNGAAMEGNAPYQQMFDIQRVEVLRGPQGTLQGRASPAGSIQIHTTQANLDEFDGYVSGALQDNDGFNGQFGISVPIIKGKLGMRIAGVYDENNLDGRENSVNGHEAGRRSKAGRLGLSWLPTDTLSFDLNYQYLQDHVDDVVVLEGVPENDALLDPANIRTPLDAFDRKGVTVGRDITDADFQLATLQINWDLPGHLLTAVTGFNDTQSERSFDQAQGNANPANELIRLPVDDITTYSQELRFASTANDRVEYMFGLFYEHTDYTFTQNNFLRPGGPFSPANQILQFPATADRLGAFTHNSFFLTDRFTLQLGLRYQYDKQDREIQYVAGQFGFPPDYEPGDLIRNVLSEENEEISNSAVTGSITLQYAFDNPDLITYLGYYTGYRPPGVTVTGADLPEEFLLFDEEHSRSLELGFKSSLLSQRLQLNGAIFYQTFDDYIIRLLDVTVRQRVPAGSGVPVLTQAGFTKNADAELLGVELEFNALLTNNWNMGGAVSYVDTQFKSGESLPCNQYDAQGDPVVPPGQVTATCDVGGDPISNEPNWSATVNTEYRIPMGAVESYVRGLYKYTGSRDNRNLGDLPGYSLFDLYLGVRTESWDVSLYGKNLLDTEAIRTGSVSTAPVRRVQTGYGERSVEPARIVGITGAWYF